MRLRLNTLLLLVLLLGALAAAPAPAGTGMFVGAAEDDGRSLDPLLAKSKLDLAAIAGLGTIRMTTIWSPGLIRAARPGAADAAERGDGRAVRRRPRDPLDLCARPPDDAAHLARPRRVRAVRRVGRVARSRDRRLHHRQRTEPQPLLDAAVRSERERSRGDVVRAAAGEDLRRAEGGVAGHQRDRRRAFTARPGQGPQRTSDAFADRVHHRPRSSPTARPDARGRSWTCSRCIRI